MGYETMMMLLLVVSTLVGVVTEAVKKLLDERSITYHANMVAGITALILAIAVGIGYTIITGTAINVQMAVYLIALVFLSWLSAMIGYDKVKQTITQIKGE